MSSARPNEGDDVRRRLVGTDPDGRTIEVLAARRGVPMRGPTAAGTGGTADVSGGLVGLVVGFVLGLVISVVVGAVLDGLADGRPWKVRVYRHGRVIVRRLHKEVLPAGADPQKRMADLLQEYTCRT